MRPITHLLAATALIVAVPLAAISPALAQINPPAVKPQPIKRPIHPTGERPIDKGPYTPDANRAYQGGGVVLQGAPGQPAPAPAPTPPGETPANAVPR